MFVVAVFVNGYNDDQNSYYSDFTDKLFDTSFKAQAYIDEEILKDKTRIVTESQKWAFHQRLEMSYEFINTKPNYDDAMAKKPKFDQNMSMSKDYQKVHQAKIQEWKEQVYNPIQAALIEWNKGLKKYIEQVEFVPEINQETLDKVKLDYKFTTKVIEVL